MDRYRLKDMLKQIEKDYIVSSLSLNDWNITRSAEHLGINRTTLLYRMAVLDVKRPINVKADSEILTNPGPMY